MKIEITNPEAKTISGQNDRGTYSFSLQDAYLHGTEKYPTPFQVMLPKGQTEPFAVGMYDVAPESFYVDRRGRLSFAPRLVPVK
nr:hypothetical protein [Oceanococcus sp. HetDA_MAG_MS8]